MRFLFPACAKAPRQSPAGKKKQPLSWEQESFIVLVAGDNKKVAAKFLI
jgi:hypothetical protein